MKRAMVFLMAMAVITMVCLNIGHGKEHIVTLPEVVVTESRVPEEKRLATSNIIIIEEDDLKNSTAKDLGDFLAEKGLGHITKYAGVLTSVGIRGFRTAATGNDLQSHVLILIDGRRAGTGNLAKVMTKNVERIEIVNGPASVQYGSAAMGGVINVITKKGRGRPEVSLEGLLGSWGYQEEGISFSGKKGGIDFSGSFSTDTRDDYETAKGEPYRNTGYKRRKAGSLNLGYELTEGHRVGVLYHYFDADHAGAASYFSQPELDDYADKKNWSYDLSYEGSTHNKSASWFIRYFNGTDEDTWVDPVASNPDGWDDGIPSRLKLKLKGAQGQFSLKSRLLSLTGGIDWVRYFVESSWDPKESTYMNYACFLLGKARLLDERLIFSAGLRYDDYDVEIKAGQGGKAGQDNLSPRFGASFLLGRYLKLRANYGEAFMMPESMQLAGDIDMWGLKYKGNPELKPEKSRTYEGGADMAFGSLNISLTYFSTRFKDKITTVTKAGFVTWENVGAARIKGFEGSISYDLGEFLKTEFEIRPYLSFVRYTTYKDDETGEKLTYNPDWTLSYGITISNGEGFSGNLNLNYMGRERVDDWETGLWPTPIVEKGGFTVANLSITKRLLDFKNLGKVTLRGEVQNLFNTDYAFNKGYPMPGRSFYLGLSYNF